MKINNRETTITFYANSDDSVTWERAYWDKDTENEINQFTANQFLPINSFANNSIKESLEFQTISHKNDMVDFVLDYFDLI